MEKNIYEKPDVKVLEMPNISPLCQSLNGDAIGTGEDFEWGN